MRFRCRQELLMASLQTAIKAISGKVTQPILEGALLEAFDGMLRITCTDLNMGIVTQLEADVSEEGRVVLPGKLLGEIVRRLIRLPFLRISRRISRWTPTCTRRRSIWAVTR